MPDGTELPRKGKLDYVSPSLDPGTGVRAITVNTWAIAPFVVPLAMTLFLFILVAQKRRAAVCGSASATPRHRPPPRSDRHAESARKSQRPVRSRHALFCVEDHP